MKIEALEEVVSHLRSGEMKNLDKAADLIEDAIGAIEKVSGILKWVSDYQKRQSNELIAYKAKQGDSGSQAFEVVCYEVNRALSIIIQ